MFILWFLIRWDRLEPFERDMVRYWFGWTSPAMKPHWRRLLNVWKDPKDISHALINLPVEWARLDPQRAVKFGIIDQFVFWVLFTLLM